MSILPYLIAALQWGAAVNYFIHGQYRLTIVWFGVGLANAAMAGIV